MYCQDFEFLEAKQAEDIQLIIELVYSVLNVVS